MTRSRLRFRCLLLALCGPWLGLAQPVNSGGDVGDGVMPQFVGR